MQELIFLLHSPVSTSSNDPAIFDQDGADGNSTFRSALKRLFYCRSHEGFHKTHIAALFKYLLSIVRSKMRGGAAQGVILLQRPCIEAGSIRTSGKFYMP